MRAPTLILTLSAALSIGGVCSAQGQNSGPEPSAMSAKGGTPAKAPTFALTQIAQLTNPFAVVPLPDGRMLATEKDGAMRLISARGQLSAPLAGVPKVEAVGQGGLLDVALAPGFAKSGLIYFTFSEPAEGGSQLALARAKLTPAALEGVTVIFRGGSPGKGGHFGSRIAFPKDGRSLYLSAGERQRFIPAQDPAQALGKVLHLTLDGKPWPGNPAAKADVPATAITVGHRNPLGMAFAPNGALWELEMGPLGGDELNLIEPGRNYGWPIVSNGDHYSGKPIPDHPTRPEFAAPRLWWNPVISPGSLTFYTGTLFPGWKGSALISGLSSKSIVRVTIDDMGRAKEAERFDMGMRVRDVVQAADGSLLVLEDGGTDGQGRLFRAVPR
ncbi:PQQ-dependent sugar dehydrogenase [Sphingomonas naphthae]|uniref:PQQ-dependent sugar dehydrogenase n=1 Tax=Sphingomonas naphthae TaxID=1813468 RepID=A0ABY7TMZ0_9SPHN|nr:PQQ-dependent sugar dehydrogenase [Sphingomonas naphthae]WCT74052.1 PQQ-dependent sugar dehydrogenase [Sphingomonas naphthae]